MKVSELIKELEEAKKTGVGDQRTLEMRLIFIYDIIVQLAMHTLQQQEKITTLEQQVKELQNATHTH